MNGSEISETYLLRKLISFCLLLRQLKQNSPRDTSSQANLNEKVIEPYHLCK